MVLIIRRIDRYRRWRRLGSRRWSRRGRRCRSKVLDLRASVGQVIDSEFYSTIFIVVRDTVVLEKGVADEVYCSATLEGDSWDALIWIVHTWCRLRLRW